jgi:hypothetical protein
MSQICIPPYFPEVYMQNRCIANVCHLLRYKLINIVPLLTGVYNFLVRLCSDKVMNTDITFKFRIFWDMTPCRLLNKYIPFGRVCCLHSHGSPLGLYHHRCKWLIKSTYLQVRLKSVMQVSSLTICCRIIHPTIISLPSLSRLFWR